MHRELILSLMLAVGSLANAGLWTKTQPDPVQTFTRTSVAYDSAGQHAANAPRQTTVALVSTSDGAVAGTEISGQYIAPRCQNSRYLFGVNVTTNRLDKTPDGTTWSATGAVVASTGDTFVGANDRLLCFRSPGVFADSPFSISASSTITDVGGNANIPKTAGFTGHANDDVAWIVFSGGYANGFYKVQVTDNDNAHLHTMADANVTFETGSYTCTLQWAAAVTNSGGKISIAKTGGWTSFETGTYMYLRFVDTYTSGYYKLTKVTANAATVQDIPYTADAKCVFVCCVGLYTSDDDGDTWTHRAFDYTSVNIDTYTASVSYVAPWGFARRDNTICVVEYGSPKTLGARYLHRSSDNGVSWSIKADLADLEPDGYHWHTIAFHAGTGLYSRWIAAFGDSSVVTGMMVSDDDGITWLLLKGSGDSPIQPIAFLDTGDPTRILAAQDSAACLCWVDLATGYMQSCFDATDHLSGRYFCFTICKVNGVYYAGGYDAGSGHAPCLWVSTDLVNWSVYHKFLVADDISGFAARYAGYLGGKLHFWIYSGTGLALRHFTISPATVITVDGALITAGVTNLRNTEALSSFETSTDLTNTPDTGCTVSRATVAGAVGSYATKVVLNNTTAGDHIIQSGALPQLTSGAKYVIQCRMKSVKPVKVDLRLYKAGSVMSSAFDSFCTVDATWRNYVSAPITANATASTFTVAWKIGKLTEPLELYIDALQVAALPVGEFALGGTDQTADTLTETVNAPFEWTDLFAVQTLGLHTHYAPASGDLFVRSWKFDTDDYLELFWDVSESKFTLKRTIAGSAEAVSASAAQEWHPNQVIKFALRVNSAGVVLDTQNGRAKEQITDGAMASLLNAAITINCGDNASANQFPGRYFDASMDGADAIGFGFIPFKLIDADVAAAFNLAPTVVAQ